MTGQHIKTEGNKKRMLLLIILLIIILILIKDNERLTINCMTKE